MDIRYQLLNHYSKENVQAIVEYIGDDAERYAGLMEIFLYGESREVQRASWVVGKCGNHYPNLAKPYLPAMIEKIKQPQHNAIQRNVLRLFQFIEIPEALLGETVDVCFTILNDPQAAIAGRAFSMTVLYNACLREPLLAEELKATIEMHLEEASAGFQSRGKKVLRQLKKLQ